MNCANVKYCDIANGTGVRTSLFVSGCTHRCPGCFNEVAWDFSYGDAFDEALQQEVLDSLAPSYIAGLSVLGGEPMEPSNQRAVYTGDVLDELLDPSSPRHTEVTERLLRSVDVLVDGPFVHELKDITLRFRGSQNQRIIDVSRSLEAGRTVLWEDDPVFAQHSMGCQELHL